MCATEREPNEVYFHPFRNPFRAFSGEANAGIADDECSVRTLSWWQYGLNDIYFNEVQGAPEGSGATPTEPSAETDVLRKGACGIGREVFARLTSAP